MKDIVYILFSLLCVISILLVSISKYDKDNRK